VLTGKGPHGLDDRHRGQMMVVTGRIRTAAASWRYTLLTFRPGPMLCAGNELATAASQAMGIEMQFENISQ
jgi:hypothetical protein